MQVVGALILLLFTASLAWAQCNQNCTHYGAPNGSGSACGSMSTPCALDTIWSQLGALPQPITTAQNVCLLPGQYQGLPSMIRMGTSGAPKISGTATSRVTVCSHDQSNRAEIDGQNVRQPLVIVEANYVTIEDIFMYGAGEDETALITHDCPDFNSLSPTCSSNHVLVQRSAFWDTLDHQGANITTVFFNNGTNNHFFDNLIIGNKRKTFSAFAQASPRIERNVFVWDGANTTGFKLLMTQHYHNFDDSASNNILLPRMRRAMDSGQIVTGCCADRNEIGDQNRNDLTGRETATAYEGNSYTSATLMLITALHHDLTNAHPLEQLVAATTSPAFAQSATSLSNSKDTQHDIFIYCDPAVTNACPPSFITWRNREYDGVGFPNESSWDKITIVGAPGLTSQHASQPPVTNLVDVANLASLPAGNTLYEGAETANLCFRTENRVLTSTPLWPWAMNQMILDAFAACTARSAGYCGNSIDIDATITSIFGSPPAQCTAASVSSTTQLNDAILSDGIIQ